MSQLFRLSLTWMFPMFFVLLYALWPSLGLPQPYYAPELREIMWNRPEGIITQGWYGRLLMAGAASAVLSILAASATSRRADTSWARFGPWIAAAAALVAMILTAAHEIRRWIL